MSSSSLSPLRDFDLAERLGRWVSTVLDVAAFRRELWRGGFDSVYTVCQSSLLKYIFECTLKSQYLSSNNNIVFSRAHDNTTSLKIYQHHLYNIVHWPIIKSCTTIIMSSFHARLILQHASNISTIPYITLYIEPSSNIAQKYHIVFWCALENTMSLKWL